MKRVHLRPVRHAEPHHAHPGDAGAFAAVMAGLGAFIILAIIVAEVLQ